MAEFVQQSIEEMLPELEQMERVKLFTKPETRQILKKRKSHEYKLRRRTKCKEDFLQYIQYEVNVLKLVEKRREYIGCTFKRMEIDVAIIQRIHKLFRLVCLRFQDDVKLWLSHIEFCKSRNERSYVSRLYTRMLQVHNKKPDLWIMAAKWEFESNINPENARSLLQRALRFNETSKKLWIEYYRLELLYAEKLRKRRELLDERMMDVEETILTGAVANVVYKKAVEKFSDESDIVLSFIDVCKCFPFTRKFLKGMYKDLQNLYPNDATTWNALARRHLDQHGMGEEKCFEVFAEAVEKIDTKEMWSFYLQACLDVLQTDGSTEVQSMRAQRARKAFSDAIRERHVTQKMFKQWVELLYCSDADWVVELLQQATEIYPSSVALRGQQLQVLINRQEKPSLIVKTFNAAIAVVPEKRSWPLWEMMLLHLMSADCPEKTHEILERAVLSCREVAVPAKELYLEWTYLTQGIPPSRDLYDRLIQLKPLSLDFFRKYIKIETCQLKPKMNRLRQAYEDALREFGEKEPDLWIDFIRLEMKHPKGNPENTGNIHSRALKTLPGTLNQEFVTKHTLLQTGRL